MHKTNFNKLCILFYFSRLIKKEISSWSPSIMIKDVLHNVEHIFLNVPLRQVFDNYEILHIYKFVLLEFIVQYI